MENQISLVLQNSSLIFQMKPKVLLPISIDMINNVVQFIRFTDSSEVFVNLRHQWNTGSFEITDKSKFVHNNIV